jgi:anti-sigma regulatory factor (Ser/Thr protein kinase)
MADDALLICSELATNAILHSESGKPGGWFAVRAEVGDGDYLWIEIEDQGGRWAEGERSDLCGRGLEIVAMLADYWDVRGDDTGRVVCTRLDWSSQGTAAET